MKNYIGKANYLCASVFVFFCAVAHAQTEDTDRIEITASLESLFDTNAFRAPNGADKRDELQNTLSLNAIGQNKSDLTDLKLDYRVAKEEYAKNSQDSDTNFFGNSSIIIGNEKSFADIEIAHTIRQVLQTPDAEQINNNAFQQQVFEVFPTLHSRTGSTNYVELKGIYSEVDFENELRSDTTQTGAQLTYLRKASKFTDIGAIYKSTSIEFSGGSSIDYSLDRYSVFLAQQSKYLAYELQAGQETISKDNASEDDSGTFWSLDATLNMTSQRFNLSFIEEFSDTSFANVASDEFTGFAVAGDTSIQDQIKISTASIGYDNSMLCRQCTLSYNFNQQEIQFLTETASDVTTVTHNIGFSLAFARQSFLRIAYQAREVEFEQDSTRNTKNRSAQLTYSKELTAKLSLDGFVRYIKRENANSSFNTNQFGIRVSYLLY